MNNEVFEAFNKGRLSIVEGDVAFDQINWSKHPTFEGVELKHIITAKDTDGHFSFHLVRIAAGKTIGNHRVISIIPAKIPHEVKAGNEGLYLFAKFMPALC